MASRTPLAIAHVGPRFCSPAMRLSALARMPFLAGLDEDAIRAVDARCGISHRDAGEAVHLRGRPAGHLHVIAVGSAKVTRSVGSGAELLLDVAGQGDVVGSLPVLGDERYADSAWALTPLCLISMDAPVFDWVLRTYPSVARTGLAVVAERLRRAQAAIRNLSGASAEQRVVAVLLTLAERLGLQRGDRLVINVPLSRDELAGLAGCAPETASRAISKLRRQGLVDAGRRWVAVRDVAALRALGPAA